MNPPRILGLHHMTAICGPAQENLDFYAGVLGLRLVKITVNFDDPGTYHFYYGDGAGSPGSILTFFPYPSGYPGRPGVGQATVTALSIPAGSSKFWVDRLKQHHVDVESARGKNIEFHAPDGLKLRLTADGAHEPATVWEGAPIPAEHAIGPMRAITLEEESADATEEVLTRILGMKMVEPGSFAFLADPRQRIDLAMKPEGLRSRGGRGSVHHIAFRTPSDEAQLELRRELIDMGLHVSPVMDRCYFKSIYFREPGGVLFEIATDPPGFTVDEPYESLGSGLKLPEALEPMRGQIERLLPAVSFPD